MQPSQDCFEADPLLVSFPFSHTSNRGFAEDSNDKRNCGYVQNSISISSLLETREMEDPLEPNENELPESGSYSPELNHQYHQNVSRKNISEKLISIDLIQCESDFSKPPNVPESTSSRSDTLTLDSYPEILHICNRDDDYDTNIKCWDNKRNTLDLIQEAKKPNENFKAFSGRIKWYLKMVNKIKDKFGYYQQNRNHEQTRNNSIKNFMLTKKEVRLSSIEF